MGNRFICMAKKDIRSKEQGSRSKRVGRSQRKLLVDEEAIHRQALAMAIQHHQLSSQRFDAGSMSRRINNGAAAVGSTSRRRGELSDPFSNSKQGQELLQSLKERKFVLVHGEGFGAWCWYKSIALMEESGLNPVAIDLSGSGIDSTDTNSVATLEDYAKPLVSYIQNLPDDEKANKENDEVYGGGDAVINLWHDSTAAEKVEAFCKEEQVILGGQELENAVLDAHYVQAIRLAFELRRPHKPFELLSDLCRKNEAEDQVSKALQELDKDEISKLHLFSPAACAL